MIGTVCVQYLLKEKQAYQRVFKRKIGLQSQFERFTKYDFVPAHSARV